MSLKRLFPLNKKSLVSLASNPGNLHLALLFLIVLFQPFRPMYGIYNALLFPALFFIIATLIRKRSFFLPNTLICFLTLYIISILISTIISIDIETSSEDIRSEFLKQMIVFFLVILPVASPGDKIKSMLGAFFISGLIMCTIGFFPFLLWGAFSTKDHRLVSFAESYTRLGYFYVLYAPFLVFMEKWKPAERLAGILILLVLSLASTFLTLTRAAWISAPLAALVFAILAKKWRFLLVFVLIMTLMFLGLYISFSYVRDRVGDFREVVDWSGSFGQRTDYIWKSASRTVRDYPVFGVGYGKYIFEKAYYLNPVEGYPQKGEDVHCDAHNAFLEILLERGVFGILTTLLLYGYFLVRAIRLSRKSEEGALYLAFFVSVSIAFALFSVTGNVYLKETGRYLWQLAGIIFCLEKTGKKLGSDSINL
ncbi:O-antigen ligase family protein [Candidatus Sumerlaeota bacterium]|nr:O-antigen ligase family protein [Candidatus Sumerlaeota bacterium]